MMNFSYDAKRDMAREPSLISHARIIVVVLGQVCGLHAGWRWRYKICLRRSGPSRMVRGDELASVYH